MHPQHSDEARHTARLTAFAVMLFLVLLVVAAVRFDLWKVPEDYSAAILLENGAAPQPVATALRRD